MACSGAHCSNHMTGCNYHRPPCPSNRPLMGGQPGPGDKILQVHIENLRQSVHAEIALYRSNPNYTWVPVEAVDPAVAGEVINERNMFLELDRMMDRVLGWGSGGSIPGYGDHITWYNYISVCNEYDVVRTNCICNSDMGTLVCTCHGDCGCHYSDMRLKKEIQYC